jgi:HSP20 family protein
MVSKQHSRGSSRGQPSSESGYFQTLISNGQWVLARHGQVWRPPTDVYETDDSIVVKVEVAGMSENDFAITFVDRTLAIAGIRRDTASKRGYHQMEILYGQFRTEVYVPETVEVNDVEAVYQDGFLVVTLPKTTSRRVTIHPQGPS